MTVTVALIVAAAENNVIGINNKMPWHIAEDFRHFKTVTMGKPCIMGRKTFDSIVAQLGRPLPGRTNIVVTRTPQTFEGAIVAASLPLAIEAAAEENPEEIMIVGGAQIYAEALNANLADKIYLTRVHQSPQGDAFFPALSPDEWMEAEQDDFDGYSFITLLRK